MIWAGVYHVADLGKEPGLLEAQYEFYPDARWQCCSPFFIEMGTKVSLVER